MRVDPSVLGGEYLKVSACCIHRILDGKLECEA
jgi:hypothetical protein